MILLFPLTGLVLSLLTVWIRGLSGSEMIFNGLFYFFDYTLLLIISFLIFLVVLAILVDLNKPNEKFSKFYNKVISFTLRLALEACNVKVTVEGEEKIPKERFVLIQNHKAMFDPMVTVAFLGKYEIGFITKPENFDLPVINKFMHRICCIGIDRENARNAVKSINAAAENIKNDVCSMAVYPEGTRARDGEMLPFRPGSLKIATKSGAPLVVTTVTNTNHVHRNAPFKRTYVKLHICKVISADEVFSSSTVELSEKARKIMCESLGIEYKE